MGNGNLNMHSLYYSLDWRIELVLQADETLKKLFELMAEYGCPMLVTRSRKSEEGYLILELVIETPSRERLSEFLKRTDGWIQFTHVRKIDETHFKQGSPLMNWMGAYQTVESLRKAVNYNEQLALEKKAD